MMEEIQVLDKGFVRLVEFMGGDLGVVNAARVSYGGVSKGEEKDRKLIGFLLQHQHMTPFEHAVYKFHVKVPLFVARQWFRHRIGSYETAGFEGSGLFEASGQTINEISARYVEMPDEFYVPEAFRVQDLKNKQGSVAAPNLDQAALKELFSGSVRSAYAAYKELLGRGVAREMCRMLLPVNLYTQYYWTVNARSLMHFIALRADAPAQWEIQQYALALARFFKHRMPWTWSAFLLHAWKGANLELDAEREALASGAGTR